MRTFKTLAIALALVVLGAVSGFAQAPVPVSLTTPTYASGITVIPITATAIVNTQTTLTIPTPPGGMTNYVCSLGYQLSNDNTGTVASNLVSTSTNFNSFAVKFSQTVTASVDSGLMMLFNHNPGGGCPKSTIPGTATTFVSPTGGTHLTFTWYATYYQAP